MGALTNAERQSRYRARMRDPDGSLLTRFQVYLSPGAHRILCQLARDSGKSKRSIIEQLLIAADPGDGNGKKR